MGLCILGNELQQRGSNETKARISLGIRKRLRKQVLVIADVLRGKNRQALTAAGLDRRYQHYTGS